MKLITNLATTNVVKDDKVVNEESIIVNISIMTKEVVTEANSIKELNYNTLSTDDKKVVDDFITFLKK